MNTDNQNITHIVDQIDFQNIQKHPNILIAAHFWEKDRFDAAKTCYKFMRRIDDMIDDRKALTITLSCMDKQLFTDQVTRWISCLQGQDSNDPFLDEVLETITKFRIPLLYFHNFAKSMMHDIHHNGFETFEQFLAYSEGASNGPASVFVHLCCLDRQNGHYIQNFPDISNMARPCALFSYIVHIIRDFRKDQLDHLNYFAADMLEKHDLSKGDLEQIAAGGEITGNFRDMIREYKGIADTYRVETQKAVERLESQIPPRYIFSLKLIFDLYLQIFERIDPENGLFTSEELIPEPEEVKARVFHCLSSNAL